jgi:hypothetical protein
MAEDAAEQAMELEALQMIYPTLELAASGDAFSLLLLPLPDDEDELNHVALTLAVGFPADYPSLSSPSFDIPVYRGLKHAQVESLLVMCQEEAQNNAGMTCVFSVASMLQDWLANHNTPMLSLHDEALLAGHLDAPEAHDAAKASAAAASAAAAGPEEFEIGTLPGDPVTNEAFDAFYDALRARIGFNQPKDEAERQILARPTGREVWEMAAAGDILDLAEELEG